MDEMKSQEGEWAVEMNMPTGSPHWGGDGRTVDHGRLARQAFAT